MKNMEENMSNLTSSVSNEASVSSTSRYDNLTPIPPQPPKKKRNQPGHPDPNAEVIALSPKTLLATNRFVCEICNKGFQRDQNLQLHRRGHNLPWKLKQRANKDAGRKKVYVCPEAKCVHHEPSRALGDLTGIKKHFSRKHGEKKWKCQKCSKKYAVQSDWKAHYKICGTREYRCDCGTLFSRRDSFITHRAFCDALGQENARKTSTIPTLLSPPTGNDKISNSASSHQTNPFQIQIQSQFNQISSNKSPFQIKQENQNNNFTLRSEIPPWLSPPPTIGPFPGGPPVPPVDCTAPPPSPPPPSIFQDFHHPNSNPSSGNMGPTMLPGGLIIRPYHSHVPGADFGLDLSARDGLIDNGLACYGNNTKADDHAVMTRGDGGTVVTGAAAGEISSIPSSSPPPFVFNGFDGLEFEESLKFQAAIDQFSSRIHKNESKDIGGNGDGMTTRDFLGLKEGDIFSLSSYMNEQISEGHRSWQGRRSHQ